MWWASAASSSASRIVALGAGWAGAGSRTGCESSYATTLNGAGTCAGSKLALICWTRGSVTMKLEPRRSRDAVRRELDHRERCPDLVVDVREEPIARRLRLLQIGERLLELLAGLRQLCGAFDDAGLERCAIVQHLGE